MEHHPKPKSIVFVVFSILNRMYWAQWQIYSGGWQPEQHHLKLLQQTTKWNLNEARQSSDIDILD